MGFQTLGVKIRQVTESLDGAVFAQVGKGAVHDFETSYPAL